MRPEDAFRHGHPEAGKIGKLRDRSVNVGEDGVHRGGSDLFVMIDDGSQVGFGLAAKDDLDHAGNDLPNSSAMVSGDA